MLSPDDAALAAHDPAIAALTEVLDPDRLRHRVERALPSWGPVSGVHLDYLRYKAGVSLTAGAVAQTASGPQRLYAVAGGPGFAGKLAKSVRWAHDRPGRGPAATGPHLGDDRLLIGPPATDRALPGGRLAITAPGRLAAGADAAVVLRHKPGRRLVLRLDAETCPVAVVKAHRRPGTGGLLAATDLLTAHGVRVPAVRSTRQRDRLVVLEMLGGSPLENGLDERVQHRAGRLLAAVHDTPAHTLGTAGGVSRGLRGALDGIRALAPGQLSEAARAAELALECLAARVAGPVALVHGDFSVDQLLDGPTLGLLDLDEARLDDPATDLASWFAAEAAAGRCDPAADPAQVLGLLLDAYARAGGDATVEARLRPQCALALLRRAVEPFRLRHDRRDWRSGIQHLVQGARVQAGGARGSATGDRRVS